MENPDRSILRVVVNDALRQHTNGLARFLNTKIEILKSIIPSASSIGSSEIIGGELNVKQ